MSLRELEGKLPGVKNYRVTVKEMGEDILFLRRIVRGGADRSFGIQVARLAGLPEAVLARARQILADLETRRHRARPAGAAAGERRAGRPCSTPQPRRRRCACCASLTSTS